MTLKIQQLKLSNLDLTDAHVDTLVSRCNRLTALDISGCYRITNKSLTSITDNLNSTLEKLKMSFSNIRPVDGFGHIIERLRLLQKLQVLNLSDIHIATKLRRRLPQISINQEKLRIAGKKRVS